MPEDIINVNPEVVEPEVDVVDTGAEGVEPAEPQQEPDDNAKFAAARRKAEEETRRIRNEFAEKEANLNDRVRSLFKGHVNPKTNKPIETMEDYLDAIAAQRENQAKASLQKAGLDYSVIEEAVANNAAVREAKALIEKQRIAEGQRIFNEQMAEITKIDPSIKTIDDIAAKDNFEEFDKLVRGGTPMNVAYRAVYFDELVSKQAASVKQAAINNAKAKSHLAPTGGDADPTHQITVPSDVMATFREMFPGESEEKLRERYKRATQ